jgi:hypothetical protein
VPAQFGRVTAGFFHGVGQHGQLGGVKRPRRQGTPLVSGLGEANHLGRHPARGDGDGAERIAEHVSQQGGLV